MPIPQNTKTKSYEIQAAGLSLSLQSPVIMGILNITADSFFDGGKYNKGDAYLQRVEEMCMSGAKIIDIGATSSRPGSPLSVPQEEWKRLQKVVRHLRKLYPHLLISVDTYHADLVALCAQEGVNIINDISGGAWDKRMYEEVAKHDMAYVMMHTQGQPQYMQDKPSYRDVVGEVQHFFSTALQRLEALDFSNIILDPGYGFGKTVAHNYSLLAHLDSFVAMGKPVLAGLSRKSMAFRPLAISAQEALNATTVLNTLALSKGAHILRVHDVEEAAQAIKIYQLYEQGI